MSSASPNSAAVIRLVVPLLLEQNDEWQLPRRYMHLQGYQSLSYNKPPLGCPQSSTEYE